MQLPTKSVRICTECGAGHFDDQASMCHACGASLGTAEIVNHVYRIENVATQPAERITANDEERQRQGFELQTTFEWAVRDHELDVQNATASDSDGEIARLAYGPGATITRLNKGLRRRADKKTLGFKIDPVSGYWAKNEDEDDNQDPTASPRQWIVPSVQDRKNALLFTPLDDSLTETSIATLQHALLRGIEAVYQLEEGEILAEPMPTRSERNGFLCYEATEGGAGVLIRLVAEPDSLAAVARKALQVMHFDVSDDGPLPEDATLFVDQPGTACVAACYRCLMSYYNQPDHELIDRRDEGARWVLRRLASGRAQGPLTSPPPAPDTDASEAALDWTAEASRRALPPNDPEPLTIGSASVAIVWRRHYVAVLLEEPAADAAAQLDDLGFEVIRFGERSTWNSTFDRLAAVLGRQA